MLGRIGEALFAGAAIPAIVLCYDIVSVSRMCGPGLLYIAVFLFPTLVPLGIVLSAVVFFSRYRITRRVTFTLLIALVSAAALGALVAQPGQCRFDM